MPTSTSALAHIRDDGNPEIVPNSDGERLTPSVVFFDQFEEVKLVGSAAKDGGDPERTVHHIKRHMDATLKGYGLDKVTQISWEIPQEAQRAHEILSSETVRKAPILPGFVTYLEEKSPDYQQAGRYGTVFSYEAVI